MNPDVAIAVDVGVAGDTPGLTKREAMSKCGDGPILLIYDASMIPNTRFRDFVIDTAKEANIPLQIEFVAGGGTDAGKFHTFGSGYIPLPSDSRRGIFIAIRPSTTTMDFRERSSFSR